VAPFEAQKRENLMNISQDSRTTQDWQKMRVYQTAWLSPPSLLIFQVAPKCAGDERDVSTG